MKNDFDHSKASKVEITVNDKKYSASYFLEKGIITVISTEHGKVSTQLGNSTPESLAKFLLRELIEK